MFWNRKKKLPISEEDKIWIGEDLNWIKNEFGRDHFMEIRTVTPTKNFYERDFDEHSMMRNSFLSEQRN